jgi:hypothetical protein
MPRTIANPAEQWRALEETTASWGSLRNMAYGRATEPRAVPEPVRELQSEILAQHERYRAWQDRITWADALLPALGSELGEWRRLYNDLAGKWSRAMKATVIQLPAVRGPGEAAADTAADAAKELVAPGGGLFWLALAGFGVYLYVNRNKGGAPPEG